MEVNQVENSRLYTLNNFFTRVTFHDSYTNENSLYKKVVNKYIENIDNKTNEQIFKEIYSLLSCSYRNEYFYKNTLLNKLLIGVHSINTTIALTEIPIASSKADFVLINGKGVVYEIKTELDNLERLPNQILDYYKAFDHVAVVSCWNNLKSIESIIDELQLPVGIYILQKNCCLKTIRKPLKFDLFLDKHVLFRILRKNEYEKILKTVCNSLPNVNDFDYYSTCKEVFCNIPISILYPEFLNVLKKRNEKKKEFINLPYELRFLGYFMDISNEEYNIIYKFLKTSFRRKV